MEVTLARRCTAYTRHVSNLTAFGSVACYGCQHMPTPEQGGGRGPDRPRGRAVPPQQPQQEPSPWYRAARYETEPPSERAYFQAQETIYQSEADVSAYRLMLEQIYHVAVLGGAPAEAALQERIENILYAEGTPTQLPEAVLTALHERRQHAEQIGAMGGGALSTRESGRGTEKGEEAQALNGRAKRSIL